jgi:predicted nucleic-acid-binding protein
MVVSAGSLDTNVLLRLLLNDIADQHRAVVALLKDPADLFVVADTAIIELAFVLERHYGFDRSVIAEAVAGLMALTQIQCNRALFEKALPIFVNHKSLSFEDCCLAVYAELHDAMPLWTFDRKLARQAPSVRLVTAH